MLITCTQVGVQHGLAILQAQNNPGSVNLQPQNSPQLAANIPVQIQLALPIFIPATPVRVQDAPLWILKAIMCHSEYLTQYPIPP